MNTRLVAISLYGDQQCQEYLRACKLVDESGKQESEVKNATYVQILKEALSFGKGHIPLSGENIASWSSKMCEIEALPESVCTKLSLAINQGVQQNASSPIERIVFSTGQILYACGACSACSQLARKIEFFVLSYVLSYHALPLIFIKDSEYEYFISCHNRPEALSVFLADKVRERCVNPQGVLFTRTSIAQSDNATETYQSDTGEKVSVEWHALFRAKRQWQQG